MVLAGESPPAGIIAPVDNNGHRLSPAWSFSRFGQTATELPDGRKIYIAGEHEDSYDPDFWIYNDVIVQHADGEIEVYGYPRDVFQPTDFHSATAVGGNIIVVGNLGYPDDRRVGVTPVYSLDLSTWSMTFIETRGDGPGWIHKHSASLVAGEPEIMITGGEVVRDLGPRSPVVENIDDWVLDTHSWTWRRATTRRWTQVRFFRTDGRYHSLALARSAISFLHMKWAPEYKEAMEKMVRDNFERLHAAYGKEANPGLIDELYRPPVPHQLIPSDPDQFGVFRIEASVPVRYVEKLQEVRMIVEGQMPDETLRILIEDLRAKLGQFENTQYEAEVL
jgi:hypothetical protein